MQNNLTALFALAFLCSACSTSAEKYQDSDLNYCVTNADLIVSAAPGAAIHEELKIHHCNYIQSGGDKKIITVDTIGESYTYEDEVRLGGKVYMEYRFQKTYDLLLISYGYDVFTDNGAEFDYLLYEVGGRGLIEEGTWVGRPLLSDVLSE
ncbi:MAG: hypothetical protein MRY59_10635 [Aquisalinus sp.]|nr:hypothetical protein [Aquisalinus sp.]